MSSAPEKPTSVAAEKAREQFLENQALALLNQVRVLKLTLLLADDNQELSGELKSWLYKELMQCAAVVEVREL
jgi:hypothetical protein